MITRISCIFFILLATLNAQAQPEWRTPDPDNLVYLELQTGTAIIELAPFMAPEHVKRFKNLVDEGFYNGLDFYRVIDGFVAQAGDLTEKKATKFNSKLPPEFTRTTAVESDFLLIQSPDFIAPETGYLNGFSAGRDPKTNEEWLLHCPGTLAFARDVAADSATTEFYITLGQATRHLDRNMSTVGRVIYGMPAIQALNRADMNNASGVIEDTPKRSKIISATFAMKVPVEKQLHIQIQNQRSQQVTDRINSARNLSNEFFHFKGNGNLDLCYYQLKSKLVQQTSEDLKADK